MLYFVWSYCNQSDTTEDTGWVTIPVSMKLFPWGSGHAMMMCYPPNYIGMKYVYINQQSVKGYAGNVQSGTSSTGVKYDNTAFSLRGIYGQW